MKLIVCITIFFLCSFNGYAQEKAIIFKNVNVVDVVEGNIRKGQDVVIKEGIIQAIGKNVGTGVSGEVKDLTGMYMMPGLIDAHVHIANGSSETLGIFFAPRSYLYSRCSGRCSCITGIKRGRATGKILGAGYLLCGLYGGTCLF